ncbi:hypothetical protein [Paraflavitalea sp. CAU 1676]|uniref:hypothetical protein n=1 Tax=Paraflavitalea sp. CAU 1676 TaxID=3032598 RepID=UPI0023DBBF32|nr:hypothetical protein [Paraflavitalea sp. CAU 1676]MDF2191048.1 hypothetical protein [Paraflavitalea sp. CAU 1676]
MKVLTSLVGGLAGAISVTILHEIARKLAPSAPRLDKLGEHATARLIEKTGHDAPRGQALRSTALAGDLIGNTLYYSLAGTRINKALTTGSLLGLGAGIGALKLPQVLGFNEHHTNNTPKKRWLTMGLYIAGGLIAAGVTKWLENRANKKPLVARTKAPDEAYKPVLDITV